MSVKSIYSRQSLLALAVLSGTTAVAPVSAQTLFMGNGQTFAQTPAYAVEVPDERLAQMRGRFISAGELLFFGVEMYTQWQTGAGELLTGGLAMNMDFTDAGATSFRPTVSVVLKGQLDGNQLQADGPAQLAQPSGGIKNVTGVAQYIAVSGDQNRIVNDTLLNVSVRRGDALRSPEPRGLAITYAGTTSIVSDSGVITTASIGNNSLGISMVAPGGTVLQQIQGGLAPGSGIVQSADISSSINQIHNVINLNVQLRDSSSSPGRFDPAVLDTLKGLPLP